MKKNVLYQMFGAVDYQKLIGFTIVDVCDTADEEGNESVFIELRNDFGVSLDMSIEGGEVHANQPYKKEDKP